jgi:hypothetical protein
MHLFNRRYLNPVIYYIAVALLVFNIIFTLFSPPEIFERLALFSAIFALVIIGNFIYGFYQTQQQPQHTLIFAMLDVDFFKNYNDYYGHLKGDEILKNLVRIIQGTLPPSGYLAR